MSHPWEKLSPVSAHGSSLEKTVGKIVNGLDNMILFRPKCGIGIYSGQNHRCRSTTKVLVPLGGTDKQVTSLNDGFRHLRIVEPFDRASTKSLIGGPAQPTPTKEMGSFIQSCAST